MNAKTKLSEKQDQEQELKAYQEYAVVLAGLARKFAQEYPEAPLSARDVGRELQTRQR